MNVKLLKMKPVPVRLLLITGHANMLTLNGKSTGNNILPREILTGENTILNKAFSASVDFFMLQALQKHS
jgi:hypothetical protein